MPLSSVVNRRPERTGTHSDTAMHHRVSPEHTHTQRTENGCHLYCIIPTQNDAHTHTHSSTHPMTPSQSQESDKTEPEPTCLIGLYLSKQYWRHGMKLNVLKNCSVKVTDFSTRHKGKTNLTSPLYDVYNVFLTPLAEARCSVLL